MSLLLASSSLANLSAAVNSSIARAYSTICSALLSSVTLQYLYYKYAYDIWNLSKTLFYILKIVIKYAHDIDWSNVDAIQIFVWKSSSNLREVKATNLTILLIM